MKGLSIVVTYYKGEKFIFKCLDSVFDSYDISDKSLNYEVVVVIDSMDDAEHIAGVLSQKYQSRPLTILKNEVNIGVSASRNYALNKIKYQFYTIIDQDDYVKPDYFKALAANLDENVAVHIINGTILQVDQGIEVPIYYLKPGFNFDSLLLKNTIIYTPGLLIINAKFIPAKDFFISTSDKYKGCDDWAAYLNALVDLNDSVSQKFITQPLFVYCLHATNYSNNKEEMILSSVSVLDYLNKKPQLSKSFGSKIAKSYQMHDFYYAKDVGVNSKLKLFTQYPGRFLSHYVFSFFNMERMNRLIFRVRFLMNRIAK